MSIVSHAFGSVRLTDKDAETFTRQVRYGKPKAQATASLKHGIEMSKQFQNEGRKLTLALKVTPTR